MAVTKGHVILDPSSGSGDTQLGVSPAEITVPQYGSVVNVQVTTNTIFTVS